MDLYKITGIICLSAAIALALAALYYSGKRRASARSLKAERKKVSSFFIIAYSRLLNIPVLRRPLLDIRKRLEVYSESDENVLRKQSVILLFTSVLLYVILVLAFLFITGDWFLLMLFAVLLSFVGDTVVDVFIHNIQIKLLKQQVYYLELLHHKYYEQKSVEDANYEACGVLNGKDTYEVYVQAERINDILTSSDMEGELEKYYETAPNKYFKMLAGILYITKEYGDTAVDGSSVFIRCITYLGSEIKAEIFKREKLKYALKSLNVISIIPLFFLKPLRNWAAASFAPLENFYSSKTGIILGVTTILASVISYMILRKLQYSDKILRAGYISGTLEQRLYAGGLYRIVDRMVPKDYSIKKNNLTELIKNAMASLNIYTLYTRRLLFGCGAFLLGAALVFGLNIYARYAILYLPRMPQGYLGGQLSEDEIEKLQIITDQDREIILTLGSKNDDESVSEALKKAGIHDSKEIEASVGRIREKTDRLDSNIFWWWELLICLALFAAGYHAPVMALRFMAKVRKIDMEEEVSQFQTIILMLMHMNRVHVEEILEWMEKFSVQFKEPLQKCLLNFSSGQYEALEELKSNVAFPPLVGIIENLQLACENLGVARAFEELENEMSFNRETRKETNERIVEKKKNLGMVVGFLPVYALIALYLIIPMIVSGMQSIEAFYRQLSAF